LQFPFLADSTLSQPCIFCFLQIPHIAKIYHFSSISFPRKFDFLQSEATRTQVSKRCHRSKKWLFIRCWLV